MNTRKKAKRIFAKVIPLFLIITVIIGFAAPAASAADWLPSEINLPFVDVPGDAWFRNYVGWAYANGITTGTSSTTFSPAASVTRGQFVTFLYRIAGTPAISGSHGFHDVSAGEFFTIPVLWAAQIGVTTGTSPTTFSPNAYITREQLVTMLHRYIGDLGLNTTAPTDALNRFPDGGSVSSWATVAMRWGAHNGIIGAGGTLNPLGNTSRAETVAMLQRVVNTFGIPRIPPVHPPNQPPNQPPTQPPPSLIPVESLTLSHTTLLMNRGSWQTINATVYPANATNRNVQFSSNNASVATVSLWGTIQAVGEGSATITATAGGVSATVSVTVIIPVTGLSINLDRSPAQLKINGTGAIIVNILPSNATDQSVQLSVNNSSVLSITQEGRVTGRARGTATITATTSNGLSRNVLVTVSPSSITLPNRRVTDQERQVWISDYTDNGGPTATELEVIRLINIERANESLVPVSMDISLMRAARYFAQQAYDLRGLYTGSHNFGPYATIPSASHGASQNVAEAFGGDLDGWNGGNWFSSGSLTAEFLVNGWMNSLGHRNLIMTPEHRFIGVGQYPGGISYMYMSANPSN